MLLIATDEAGYGPKLGPLVIAATVWEVPDGWKEDRLHTAFAPLRQPVTVGTDRVVVNDSKAVYQASSGLSGLHAAVTTSLAWCGINADTFESVLAKVCPNSFLTIQQTPWLRPDPQLTMMRPHEIAPLMDAWRTCEISLIDVRAIILPASEFNRICRGGFNKADLLSQSTLHLVRDLWQQHASDHSECLVYCDRHGGRRYYAAVLQHVIPEAWVQIEAESPQLSRYRLNLEHHMMRVHFTVKGDSFTPVALASMHAKYFRERMMESFNAYFRQLAGDSLRPTAGYPVDADRFLADIADVLDRHAIDRGTLIRCR